MKILGVEDEVAESLISEDRGSIMLICCLLVELRSVWGVSARSMATVVSSSPPEVGEESNRRVVSTWGGRIRIIEG